jgi:hypothetical protein
MAVARISTSQTSHTTNRKRSFGSSTSDIGRASGKAVRQQACVSKQMVTTSRIRIGLLEDYIPAVCELGGIAWAFDISDEGEK